MWVKPVLVFTTPTKIHSGSSVQGSKIPKYLYIHTLTANGAEQDFPVHDIFQQAEDAAAPGRGAEANNASQCTLATPILVLQQCGGEEVQLPWRRSCEEA